MGGSRPARLGACIAAVCAAGIGAAVALGGSVTPGANNWGGYVALAAQGQTFGSVSATFVVPQLDCSGTAGQLAGGTFLEIWSALDGAYPGAPLSVEQVGVEPGCHNGAQANPTAYAVQFAKNGRATIATGGLRLNGSVNVPTGDSVTAIVARSGALVTMTLTDNSTGATASISKKCPKKSCSFKSAEAIVEAPGPIASFGAVSFAASSATDSSGHTSGVVTSGPWWNTEQLTLLGTDAAGHRQVPCATPGPYSTGSGAFTMTGTQQCVAGS